ncbi:MAG: hypothetical protein ACI9TO_000882 [Rickettsiales bacterium]|jgi:hypothetical protein
MLFINLYKDMCIDPKVKDIFSKLIISTVDCRYPKYPNVDSCNYYQDKSFY